jgi:hypothetical protein
VDPGRYPWPRPRPSPGRGAAPEDTILELAGLCVHREPVVPGRLQFESRQQPVEGLQDGVLDLSVGRRRCCAALRSGYHYRMAPDSFISMIWSMS